jgi:molybdopterin-synthase adenylyltransferase
VDRYHRQTILPQIGPAGQKRLAEARLLLIGCGALGCALADQLVRAGVGFLRLVDRDVVELTNLQRQTLFDEEDARASAAKAEAAATRLRQINSTIHIEPIVADVWAGNIEELSRSATLILDGTDNVQTRYLLNDAAVKLGIPWVHAACVGTEGRVMAILPKNSPCLRCVFPTPPAAGELPTCDTAGILGPAASASGALAATAAIKIITGQFQKQDHKLQTIDVWSGRFSSIDLAGARDPACPCCGQRKYEFLDADRAESSIALCGRNAVQIRLAPAWDAKQFDQAITRLAKAGQLEHAKWFTRCRLHEPAGWVITCFRDGRLMIAGTSDLGRAKSICARYIGS